MKGFCDQITQQYDAFDEQRQTELQTLFPLSSSSSSEQWSTPCNSDVKAIDRRLEPNEFSDEILISQNGSILFICLFEYSLFSFSDETNNNSSTTELIQSVSSITESGINEKKRNCDQNGISCKFQELIHFY